MFPLLLLLPLPLSLSVNTARSRPPSFGRRRLKKRRCQATMRTPKGARRILSQCLWRWGQTATHRQRPPGPAAARPTLTTCLTRLIETPRRTHGPSSAHTTSQRRAFGCFYFPQPAAAGAVAVGAGQRPTPTPKWSTPSLRTTNTAFSSALSIPSASTASLFRCCGRRRCSLWTSARARPSWGTYRSRLSSARRPSRHQRITQQRRLSPLPSMSSCGRAATASSGTCRPSSGGQ